MSRAEILGKITGIFRDVLDDETLELKEETSSGDIEDWDSLVHISIVMEVMKEFQIKLEMDEVGNINNVRKMIDAIVEKLV